MADYVADELEFLISELSEILGLDEISEYSDFFDLGADSLDVVELVSRVSAHYNVFVPASAAFSTHSLVEFADEVRKRRSENSP